MVLRPAISSEEQQRDYQAHQRLVRAHVTPTPLTVPSTRETQGRFDKAAFGQRRHPRDNASARTADVSTSYGRITCRQSPQMADARSGSGNLDVTCSDATPPDLKATLVTSYGGIDFTCRPFAGQVDLSTRYGPPMTAVTTSGELGKKRLQEPSARHGKAASANSSGSIA